MPGNNTRLFLTGSTHNEGSYPIQWGKVIYHSVDVWTPYSIADNVGTYNPFADHHDVTGVIQYMDFPESGEWLAVAAATTSSPVNGYVHHIYVPASGFSTTYTAQTTGNSYDLKAADGCAFSIDAREITIEINRLDGIPVGTYTTGGSLTSVDIAMKNGLWAVAGSTDGKFYVFSKDATSGWYQDYASDSEDSVTCVAMSWRGEMVVVGRIDGSVLMYPTGGGTEDDDDDTTDTTFPAQITVFQDGRLAVGKTVVIEKSETSNPYTWTAYATEQTDAQGKVVIPDADNGAFYKLTVDEKETVYAASSTSPQFTISVMTPIINGQWEFEAIYDEDTNIITGSYTDVEPAQSITIRIVNTNTKQLVAQQTVYGNNQLIVTVAGNPEHVYKVDVDAVRFTGNQIRMSKIVHTASIYNIPLGDLDVHMKNAIFTLIIMAVGGLFSYAHSTKGGLLLVALAGGFALFGFTTVSYAMIGIAGFVAIISILIRGTRR
jgi:FlaG/FlaF family flagellin (archaellin)